MTAIPIQIVDNCPHVAAADSYLYRQLRRHFNVELSGDPDFLFYSVFGQEHANRRYDRCGRIWFTGENFRPDFSVCDYALSFDYLEGEPRHLRVPLYLHYIGSEGALVKRSDFDALSMLRSKSRFCNFVYSNDQAKTRIKFFQLLSEYKPVDSGGQVYNNMGHVVRDKQAFLSDYKFTIAFENAQYLGYTTEKLVLPMMANSLPIYWGNSKVGREFNTRSFINTHEYSTFEDVVDEIIRLDQDDGRYIARLKEPWLIGNTDSIYTRNDYMVPFFRRVFSMPRHAYPKWATTPSRDFGLGGKKAPSVMLGPPEHRVFE